MRVLHIINSLDVGGAERNLLKLIDGLTARGVVNEVMALRRHGALEPAYRRAASALHPLRSVDVGDYDLFCGWLYQGCVVASVLGPSERVIWNIRHNLDERVRESWATKASLALMSTLISARAVVANSRAGLASHRERGLRAEDWVLIETGVDVERFAPGRDDALRQTLGIDSDALVVLQVGRVHPHKGHRDLIEAFAEVAADRDDVHLILVGEGTERLRGTRVHGLGLASDVRPCLAAGNLLVNPSLTESFPTAVLEAMGCGLPCVVTRAGASADLVGDTGFVSDFGAPALADALRTALALGPDTLRTRGQAARDRVVERYSEARALDAYHQFLQQTMVRR